MDVNKIIMESIQDVIGEGVKEKVSEAGEAVKEKAGAVAKKAGEIFRDDKITAKDATSGGIIAPEDLGKFLGGGEVKDQNASVLSKFIGAVKENPGIAAGGTAAAIAAGLGALALRKKLAATAKKSTAKTTVAKSRSKK